MNSPARRQAFTLIELLVVISIIAILATLLLPGVNLVREQAKQSKCRSGLRQVAMACFGYANDQENILPDVELGSSMYWTRLIQDYLDQGTTANNSAAYSASNFFQYCSTFDRNRTGSGYAVNAQLRWGNGGTGDNNAHNRWAVSTKTNWTSFTLGAITKPAGRLYLSDSFIDPASSNMVYRNYLFPTYDGASLWDSGFRHQGKMMVAMLDGHATTFRQSADVTTGLTGDW